MKYLEKSDVSFIGSRARITLSEITKVMKMIDSRATTRGLQVKDRMTFIEVNTLYNEGEEAIKEAIDGQTPTERRRNISRLKLSSVEWYIQKTKKHRNSNFRVTLGILMWCLPSRNLETSKTTRPLPVRFCYFSLMQAIGGYRW